MHEVMVIYYHNSLDTSQSYNYSNYDVKKFIKFD